ncbi:MULTISPECIES: hypothetical protein [unclassified Streptomyces]|uniref:hypothetical protein n=1 Tax=unclassified Streptomyces TaxID=2593676 RepID=UPI0015A22F17
MTGPARAAEALSEVAASASPEPAVPEPDGRPGGDGAGQVGADKDGRRDQGGHLLPV